MAYEFVTTDPGSGGANYLVDVVTIGPDTINVILNAIVTGADGGPYTGVGAANPFPVTLISSSITLPVSIAGTVIVDSELPAAAALADNTVNPTVPGVGSFLHCYDGSTWDRVRGDSTDGILVNLGTNNDVTITGTVPISIAGTVTVDTELGAAVGFGDNQAIVSGPILGSLLYMFDGGAYDRVRGDSVDGLLVNLGSNNDVTISGTIDTELPSAAALSDNTANPTVPGVGSFNLWYDGSTWDRARGDSTDGLLVNLGTNNDVTITGTVPVSIATTVTVNSELPASITVADDMAASLAPQVIALTAVFDGTNWDRARGDATNGQLVDLGANNDVTITGTVPVSIAATVVVDTELAAAAALADNIANPTVTSVGSFGLLWDGAAWDRAPGNSTDGQLVNLGANNDVTLNVPTSGGLSVARDIDLDEASPANIKASAGQVFGWYLYNNAATTRYIKLYNKASAPVLASDTPLLTIAVPGGSAANVDRTHGLEFTLGIGWAATTGVADTDTGAPAANDVVANLFYK